VASGIEKSPAATAAAGDLIAALLLLVSGAAGLIYQLLWIKQLSLIVGVDVHAIAVAVSAFFAGLAVGSAWIGRHADAHERPVRLYAALELGIAVLGVTATLALAHSAGLFASLEARAGLFAWLLPFALVGIPAVLMGGTIPVMMRVLQPASGDLGRTGGVLYAANTCGAIAGSLLCVFALVPALGVRGAAIFAGALNVVASAGALILLQRKVRPPRQHAGQSESARPAGAHLAVVLYTIAGAVALGYEVAWSQAIVQWTSTRTFAFAIVLATYLGGLALGGVLAARRVDRARDPWGTFALLISGAGLVALLELVALGAWLEPLQVRVATLGFQLTGSEAIAMSSRFVTAALCVVFVPTVLLGAAFPFALRLYTDARGAGADTGLVLAVNTAGGVAGTLLAGFALIPVLGVERTLGVLAVVASTVGLAAVLRGSNVQPATRAVAAGLATIAVIAAVTISPAHLAGQLAHARGGELRFHEASAGGTVAVIEQGRAPNQFRRLYIQGVSNSGDSLASRRYMRLQALLPLIIHAGEPRSALVIGLGTGITAGSLLRYPGLTTRVCAELLPAVTHAAQLFNGNYGVMGDPRLTLRLRDGRRELLRDGASYDLITLEPPPPSAAGVVNLYSREFYELAAARLNAQGLLAQWLPLPTQTTDATRSLVRSFLDVFPHATLWSTELHEGLLVGSLAPIELDTAKIITRFEQPDVASTLREVGIASPAALLATWVTDRAGLETFAAAAPSVTDDRPRIEYSAWVLPGEFARVLPELFSLQTHAPLQRASDSFRSEVGVEHERLLRFYEAGLYAYADQRELWERTLASVLAEDGNNPYYRWIAGGGT